jgi:hypothetical protein
MVKTLTTMCPQVSGTVWEVYEAINDSDRILEGCLLQLRETTWRSLVAPDLILYSDFGVTGRYVSFA